MTNLIDNEQFWKYAKMIPHINTTFGSIRVIRNLFSGNYEEAIKSGLYAVGGMASVSIAIHFKMDSDYWFAFLVISAINNFIGGFGSFIVDICCDQSLRTANWSDYERVFYQSVIKETPLFAWYCFLRFYKCFTYGDLIQARVSVRDILIILPNIIIAIALINKVDIWKLVTLIEDNSGSTKDGFTAAVLNSTRQLLTSQVFTLSAIQCINVGGQLVGKCLLLHIDAVRERFLGV